MLLQKIDFSLRLTFISNLKVDFMDKNKKLTKHYNGQFLTGNKCSFHNQLHLVFLPLCICKTRGYLLPR